MKLAIEFYDGWLRWGIDGGVKALKEVGYQGDMTLEIPGFLSRYDDYGLLMPALQFAAAVGRKLIEMFHSC